MINYIILKDIKLMISYTTSKSVILFLKYTKFKSQTKICCKWLDTGNLLKNNYYNKIGK